MTRLTLVSPHEATYWTLRAMAKAVGLAALCLADNTVAMTVLVR